MNKKLLAVVLIIVLCAPTVAVMAQQVGSEQTDQLREQIARFTLIESDPSTPVEVRELNGRFLRDRRARLGDVLRRRVAALRKYVQAAGAALTEQENKAVAASIEAIEKELSTLRDGGEMNAPQRARPASAALTMPASYERPSEKEESSTSLRYNDSRVSDTLTPQDVNAQAQGAAVKTLSLPVECDVNLSDSDEVTYAVTKSFEDFIKGVNLLTGAITNPDMVINGTLYNSTRTPAEGDYTIIHLIRWEQYLNDKKYDALRDRWTLYRYEKTNGVLGWKRQNAFQGTRIYGHKRVHVLLIHLNAENAWDINYTVSVKKKRPANVTNALDLLGIITKPLAKAAKRAEDETHLWGGGLMCIQSVPSDIAVQGEIIVRTPDDQRTAIQQPKTYSKTYDNEGKYFWDVSIGVPFNGIKEAQFDASDGTVRAKQTDRQNAYGFLNLFPTRVDVKGNDFLNFPHLVLGVPLSKKPLDRPIVALGYGVRKFDLKFDFFAGIVFNKVREPRTLVEGATATQSQLEADFETRRIRKFVFGVNLPLRQVKDALSGQ